MANLKKKNKSACMWITYTNTVHMKTRVLYISISMWVEYGSANHFTSVPTFFLCDSLCVRVHTSMHKTFLSAEART